MSVERISTIVETNEERIPTRFEQTYVSEVNRREYVREANVRGNSQLIDLVHNGNITLSGYYDTYRYIDVISTGGGEGAVLRCQNSKKEFFAAKIYRDSSRIDASTRARIIEFTNIKDAARYVLPIVDYGFVTLETGTQNYFEIQPFCPGGDLYNKGKFSFEQIRNIANILNECLNFIHMQGKGFVHRDVKPENIYEYKGNYVLGDFGLAKQLQEGVAATEVNHYASGTPGYKSIEFDTGIFTPAVDYYSLGITLASLYAGHFIITTNNKYDSEKDRITKFTGHVDLGDSDDPHFVHIQKLVDGLCMVDYKERFGYEEVKRWVADPNFCYQNSEKLRGSSSAGRGSNWLTAFQGNSQNDQIWTSKDFYKWISENWNDAKARLQRGIISQHFKNNNELWIYNEIENIIEYEENPDVALFKTCLIACVNEDSAMLVWKGQVWNDIYGLASDIANADDISVYKDIFENKLLSQFLKRLETVFSTSGKIISQTRELVEKIEQMTDVNLNIAMFWFAYMYIEEDRKKLKIHNHKFDNVLELLNDVIDSSYTFYREKGYLEYLQNIESSYKFFAFLCAGADEKKSFSEYVIKYLKNVELTKNECEKLHLLLLLFESIGNELGDSTFLDKLRNFYIKFGPYGDIVYIHNIVKNKDYYIAGRADGKEVIEEIRKIPDIQKKKISEMAVNILDMKKSTDKLYTNLQNNVMLARAGIFEGKAIKCKNMSGYFGYQFLGKNVPYGYEEIIERN